VEFADKGKLKARAEVNNLIDKYHESYLNYADPGRSFYVGLVYSY
jgi:outer membrane cobalamin receptor